MVGPELPPVELPPPPVMAYTDHPSPLVAQMQTRTDAPTVLPAEREALNEMPGQALMRWVAVSPHQTGLAVGQFFDDMASESRRIVVDGFHAALDFIPNRLADARLIQREGRRLGEGVKAAAQSLPAHRESELAQPVGVARNSRAVRMDDVTQLDRTVNGAIVHTAQDAAPVLKPLAIGALAPVAGVMTAGLVTPAMLAPLMLVEPLADMGLGLWNGDGKTVAKGLIAGLTILTIYGVARHMVRQRMAGETRDVPSVSEPPNEPPAASSGRRRSQRLSQEEIDAVLAAMERRHGRIEQLPAAVEARLGQLFEASGEGSAGSALIASMKASVVESMKKFNWLSLEAEVETSMMKMARAAAQQHGVPEHEVQNVVYAFANRLQVRASPEVFRAVLQTNEMGIAQYERGLAIAGERIAKQAPASAEDLQKFAYYSIRLSQTQSIRSFCLIALNE